jgi:hypothetical protein
MRHGPRVEESDGATPPPTPPRRNPNAFGLLVQSAEVGNTRLQWGGGRVVGFVSWWRACV